MVRKAWSDHSYLEERARRLEKGEGLGTYEDVIPPEEPPRTPLNFRFFSRQRQLKLPQKERDRIAQVATEDKDRRVAELEPPMLHRTLPRLQTVKRAFSALLKLKPLTYT